jgi:hypothetical protein
MLCGSRASRADNCSRSSGDSSAYARVVRDFYDALGRGDLEAAGTFLTDDSALRVPGRSTDTGDCAGREAVVGFVVKAATLSQGTLKLHPPPPGRRRGGRRARDVHRDAAGP